MTSMAANSWSLVDALDLVAHLIASLSFVYDMFGKIIELW